MRNNRIALAFNHLQMEGLAQVLDHPKDNEYFKTLCEQDIDYSNYFKKYAHYKNSILIKVNPCLVMLYEGKETDKYLDV